MKMGLDSYLLSWRNLLFQLYSSCVISGNDIFALPFQTRLTCLLSGLCCITIAVFSSPAFVQFLIGPYRIFPKTLYYATGLSVVTLVHWMTYFMIPSTLKTPPHIISYIIERVLQITSFDDVSPSISAHGKKNFELISKKMKNDTHIKAASLVSIL